MRIHILGICGTFMAGLAQILKESGHDVSGADAKFYPPMSDYLKKIGIKTIWATLSSSFTMNSSLPWLNKIIFIKNKPILISSTKLRNRDQVKR